MRYYIYTGENNFELITGEQLSEEYKTKNNLTEEIFDAPEDSVTIGRDANGNWESYNQADVIAKVNAGELPS
tara:strand:- start:1426 stop:1641 length:216 start_codon:yes stop_codon:yes gene_type:complete